MAWLLRWWMMHFGAWDMEAYRYCFWKRTRNEEYVNTRLVILLFQNDFCICTSQWWWCCGHGNIKLIRTNIEVLRLRPRRVGFMGWFLPNAKFYNRIYTIFAAVLPNKKNSCLACCFVRGGEQMLLCPALAKGLIYFLETVSFSPNSSNSIAV